MKLRLPVLATSFALIAMIALTPAALAAPTATAPMSKPVMGTIQNTAGVPVGSFTGTLSNIVIKDVNGVMTATGTLSGTLTDSLGNVIGTVSNVLIQTTASVAGTTCQILNLTIGPLDLNLLGLMVHLNQVVLNITAQSGPGNLLGNLLCGIAGLLNNGGPLSGLLGLLGNLFRHV